MQEIRSQQSEIDFWKALCWDDLHNFQPSQAQFYQYNIQNNSISKYE